MRKFIVLASVPLTLAAAGCATISDAVGLTESCDGYVALTYDDGPFEFTPMLTDTLSDYELAATYFMVGEHIEQHPEIVLHAQESGIVLGTHTFSHVDDMRELSPSQQADEVQSAEDALRAVTGEEPTLWRPPHSLTDAGVEQTVSEVGSVQVMWDLDSEDWWAADPPDVDVKMQAVKDGDIVVLHDQDIASDAVPGIASILDSKGLCAVGLTPEGDLDIP